MNTAAELENARALRRFGRHKAAAEICQKILDRQPNHADALLVLGSVADDLRDSRSAIGFLTRAVDQDPKHPGAALLLAEVLAKLGIADGAVAWYRVALEVEADAARAAPALARLLAAGGRIDEIVTLARSQLDQGHPAVALEAARVGRAAAPANADAALIAGETMIAAGAPADAAGALRAATADRAQDQNVLAMLAHALGGAPVWLRRALAVRESADVRASLGAALSGVSAIRTVPDAARGGARGRPRQSACAQCACSAPPAARRSRWRDRAFARRRLLCRPRRRRGRMAAGAALTRRDLAGSAMTSLKAAKGDLRSCAPSPRASSRSIRSAWTPGACWGTRAPVILGRDPSDPGAMVGVAAGSSDENALAWLERAIRLDSSAATALPLARVLLRSGGTARGKGLAPAAPDDAGSEAERGSGRPGGAADGGRRDRAGDPHAFDARHDGGRGTRTTASPAA